MNIKKTVIHPDFKDIEFKISLKSLKSENRFKKKLKLKSVLFKCYYKKYFSSL
ncbi:MAG: hypothetical protein ABIP51_00490 [Bacteroidia bacterium]